MAKSDVAERPIPPADVRSQHMVSVLLECYRAWVRAGRPR